MQHEQLGEAINFYCIPKFFLGEAIANSLLAGAPPLPNTELILNGGVETGDLTSSRYCNQFNVSSTGGVKSNFSYTGFTLSSIRHILLFG